ncbi:hypothetical protein CEXT_492961 [Caerostris extrusa]|uniref:Uncharacterized protein n=1 Tax=Caerostris extrusa TaxID=172846 RepID=A0AAV4TZW1_CAEEX|nr:hypothetical protein CEXT_492961 [Caerostris extrusa]
MNKTKEFLTYPPYITLGSKLYHSEENQDPANAINVKNSIIANSVEETLDASNGECKLYMQMHHDPFSTEMALSPVHAKSAILLVFSHLDLMGWIIGIFSNTSERVSGYVIVQDYHSFLRENSLE